MNGRSGSRPPDQGGGSSNGAVLVARSNTIARYLLGFSVVDWIVASYVLIFGLAMAIRSPLHLADPLARLPLLSCPIYLGLARIYRSRAPTGGALRHAYHLLPVVVVALTYFNLRRIIPVVNPEVADASLAQIDLLLFGGQGSVWLERWASRGMVEWFSFWYQSYMYLGGLFLVGEVLLDRNRERNAFFAVAIILVLTIGHALYLVVPARGPLYFLKPDYRGDLPGGPLYAHVMDTQNKAGPLFDAFPSEHVAAALFLSLFIHRFYPRARWAIWPWCLLVSVSTVFLRFHYGIDVIAGATLAVTAMWAAPRLLEGQRRLRAAYGVDASDPW